MSEIEALISKFEDMCGESNTEMGIAAQEELDDLRRFVQVGIDILECHDKGLFMARDAIIDKTLRSLIHEQ